MIRKITMSAGDIIFPERLSTSFPKVVLNTQPALICHFTYVALPVSLRSVIHSRGKVVFTVALPTSQYHSLFAHAYARFVSFSRTACKIEALVN